jgi:competence protein ComFC
MNFRVILDIFFPERCVVCRAKPDVRGENAPYSSCCFACYKNIPVSDIPPARAPQSPLDSKVNSPGSIFYMASAVSYENPAVKNLVHALKFDFVRSAAGPLGDLLGEFAAKTKFLEAHPFIGAVVIPIPLSSRRERHRGFNQSSLIAQRFANKTSLTFNDSTLARIRHTKPQTDTRDADERRKNVRECFATLRKPPRAVILVDDVTTTGSTFREAALALCAAGTEHILALAVAGA